MNTRMKLAFVCYLIATLIVAIFGVIYTFKSSFMPYHSVAVAMQWSEVPENFKVLITALMRAFGGAGIAVAFAAFVMLVKQFPKETAWVKWCLPILLSTVSLGALYAMSHVIQHTQALPPWEASVVIIILSFAGYVLSVSKQAT